MTGPHEKKYVQLLNDALVQWRLMLPRPRDKRLIEEGWTTIYAVDADIVKMYANPRSESSSKGHAGERLGYGQVFSSDGEDENTVITQRLADYIFFELTGNMPLLIISPIEHELMAILHALVEKLGSEPPTEWLDQERIKGLGRVISNIRDAPEDIYEKLLKYIWLRTESPEEEYRRISRLTESRRYCYSDDFLRVVDLGRSEGQALLGFNSLSQWIKHFAISKRWYEALTQGDDTRLASRRRSTLANDAKALARLQMWNEALEASKHRIVYITGARHILDVAYGNDTELADCVVRYIRHPRYFLSHEGVLKSSAESDHLRASNFEALILTFLSRAEVIQSINAPSRSSRQAARSLTAKLTESQTEAALAALKAEPELADGFTKQWSKYLNWLLDAYKPPTQVQKAIAGELESVTGATSMLRRWNTIREKLEKNIEDFIDQTWDLCFTAAIRSGYLFGANLEATGPPIPARVLPPLRLDRGSETQKFLFAMTVARRGVEFDYERYREGVAAIQKEWDTPEDQKYIYYLVHAALFAAWGEWRIAERIAVRALKFSEVPSPKRKNNAHGREAYFLAAACRRYSFRRLEDLDIANRFLTKAIEIHEMERSVDSALSVLPERFEAERLAIAVSELMVDRMSGERDDLGQCKLREPTEDWSTRATGLNVKQRELISKLKSLLKTADELVERDLQRLVVRLQMNTCTLLVCMPDRNESVFLSIADEIEKANDGPAKLDGNYFRDCIIQVGKALSKPPRTVLKEINEQFSETNIKANLVLPYDRARFELMRDWAIESINRNRPAASF